MFKLTENLASAVEYKGRRYRLNFAFDNVLRFFELLVDEEVQDIDKIIIALEMFVYRFDLLKFDSIDEMFAFFKYLLVTFLDIDLDNPPEDDGTKIMDFQKDAELIYASFFAAYKIDLIEVQGQLDYRKFKALLAYLDDESAFKKAVSYRVVKIPAATQYNKEQIEHLRKMKQFYALEQEIPDEQAQANLQKGFTAVASAWKK